MFSLRLKVKFRSISGVMGNSELFCPSEFIFYFAILDASEDVIKFKRQFSHLTACKDVYKRQSHYYDELERIADKLLILEKGFVVDFGGTDELFLKYCGKSTMTVENTEFNRSLTANFKTIESPRHLLCFSCPDGAAETELASLFIQNNVNYRRSNRDIESIFTVAVRRFYEKRRDLQ